MRRRRQRMWLCRRRRWWMRRLVRGRGSRSREDSIRWRRTCRRARRPRGLRLRGGQERRMRRALLFRGFICGDWGMGTRGQGRLMRRLEVRDRWAEVGMGRLHTVYSLLLLALWFGCMRGIARCWGVGLGWGGAGRWVGVLKGYVSWIR